MRAPGLACRNVQKYIDFLWVMDCSCDIWLFVGLAGVVLKLGVVLAV